MSKNRIGFRLKKLFGLGEDAQPDSTQHQHETEPAADSDVTADTADEPLNGPLFIRYVNETPFLLVRSGPLPELRTLAGETLNPRSYLQIPLSADVDVADIQIILDDLQTSEGEILEAFRDESKEWAFADHSLAEVCDILADTLDRLSAAGHCRVLEALATLDDANAIRIDRPLLDDEGDRLHNAISDAAHGNAAAVAVAVKQGLDPNSSGDAAPLLHYPITITQNAAVEARMAVVSSLLDLGAEIESRDKTGWTALLTACHTGEEPMIRLLLDRGADPNAVDNKGWSPFHYLAYEQADTALFDILKQAGCDPDLRSTTDGNTALMIAVDRVDIPRVRSLLALGADPGCARHDGLTALHMVAVKESPEIARLLLDAGAPVNQKGGAPDAPPLHQAAAVGDVEMIELLLAHGADTTLLDVNGYTALQVADGNGQFEAAELLDSAAGSADDFSAAGEPAGPGEASKSESSNIPGSAAGTHLANDPEIAERMIVIREKAPTIAKTLDDLELKLSENPSDPASWKLRGILLQQMGLQTQALSCFNKVVELDEDDPDAFVYSGQIMLSSSANATSAEDRKGFLDYARDAFSTALRKDPEHVEAAIGLGVYCITLGHPEEAHPWLDQALESDPTSGKACYMKGLALSSSGRTEEAESYMARARALGFEGA